MANPPAGAREEDAIGINSVSLDPIASHGLPGGSAHIANQAAIVSPQ